MNLETLLTGADPMPVIGAIRGGRVFVVDQSEISVAECRAMMDGAGVHYHSEMVMPSGDTRVYVFRVPDEDAPMVRALLGYSDGYHAPPRHASLWWLWAIVIACIVGAMLCTVAMMGGAL